MKSYAILGVTCLLVACGGGGGGSGSPGSGGTPVAPTCTDVSLPDGSQIKCMTGPNDILATYPQSSTGSNAGRSTWVSGVPTAVDQASGPCVVEIGSSNGDLTIRTSLGNDTMVFAEAEVKNLIYSPGVLQQTGYTSRSQLSYRSVSQPGYYAVFDNGVLTNGSPIWVAQITRFTYDSAGKETGSQLLCGR